MSKGKKELSPLEKSISYGNDILDCLKRWNSYLDGTKQSFDPFYEDGYNMNTIRTQMIIVREKIEKELPKELYPKEYYLPVPEKVDNHFIALQDTLIEKGEKRLEEIKQMPSYIQLTSLGYPDIITPKEDDKHHVFYYAVVGYVKNMERSIQEAKTINETKPYYNPYLNLRRYASYDDSWWVEAFTRCINHIFAEFPTIFKASNNPVETLHSEVPTSDCTLENQNPPKVQTVQKTESSKKTSYKQYSLFDFGLA